MLARRTVSGGFGDFCFGGSSRGTLSHKESEAEVKQHVCVCVCSLSHHSLLEGLSLSGSVSSLSSAKGDARCCRRKWVGQTETVLLPCHRADWVVLWRIRICGFTSFYIQEERRTDVSSFSCNGCFLAPVLF